MPSTQLPLDQTFNITNVSYGTLTITNNSTGSDINALASNMVGYIVGPLGVPASLRVLIDTVVSPGVILIRKRVFPNTSTVGLEYDFSAFNGGLIFFEAQLASS